ncbi:hypothetical protein CLOM_g14495 [Closterium sp. NIES-68]|nr:hypothetical protein CLOM_g5660 [Closterium sp. NIES-68]GJP55535.1 hypothetical protein CLOM_g14495 [Closterium sp. NIES-68]GJP59923.1 hypothetical protein CLOP_g15974 [Closterium sp. NIES-67]
MKLRRPHTSEPYKTPSSPQPCSRQPHLFTSTEPDFLDTEWEILDSVSPAISSPLWTVTETVNAYVFCVEQRGLPLERVQVLLDRRVGHGLVDRHWKEENDPIGSRSSDQENDWSQQSPTQQSQWSQASPRHGTDSGSLEAAQLTIVCAFPSASHTADRAGSLWTAGRRFRLPPDAVAEETAAMQTVRGSLVVNVPRSPSRKPSTSCCSSFFVPFWKVLRSKIWQVDCTRGISSVIVNRLVIITSREAVSIIPQLVSAF